MAAVIAGIEGDRAEFLARAGFTHGWGNLESWARTMVDQAIEEQHYLSWLAANIDFGPAHEDVIRSLNEQYTSETGREVPDAWGCE